MLVKKVYRIVHRGMQDILLKKNKEFYLATLEVFHKELASFSHGSKFPLKLRKNPKSAIKSAFRQGASSDLDVLFGFLPRLLRYFRAAKLLANDRSLEKKKEFFLDDIMKSEFNMAPGALLVSKLFYNEKALKKRDVDIIFESGLKQLQEQFQKELEKVIEEQKFNRSTPDGNFRISLSEKRRRRIFSVIKALDRVIQQREADRNTGEDYENLVDQVLQPDEPYYRATPITHSVIFCTLINSLGLDLEAFGVSNPKHFLSRIAVKNNTNINTHLLTMQEIDIMKDANAKKNNRISFQGVKEINVVTIPGYWVCVKDDSFEEIQINYHLETRKLVASYTASNTPADKSNILWEFELDGKEKHLIKIGQEYDCIAFPDTSDENKSVHATIKFSAISPEVIESNRIASPSSAPYIEMQVKYRDTIQVKDEEGEVVVEETVDFNESYCRTTDMDWSLIRISEDGVMPITPLRYMENLKKQGHGLDAVRRIFEPATSTSVAARIAGNLARATIRLDGPDAVENGAYWSAIRRHFENILERDYLASSKESADANNHSRVDV